MHPLNRSLYVLFLMCVLPATAGAQSKDYEAALQKLHLREYRTTCGKDTVYFLVNQPGARKKTIIFCQGSGPVPLISQMPEGLYPPFPFDLDSTTRSQYNVVIISKPGIKRFATSSDLSAEQYRHGRLLQLDSLNRPPAAFVEGNNLYKLSADCMAVVRYLRQQPWVDKNNIVLFGHSQGAMLAAYTASKNQNDIRALVFAQCNAYSVYAGYLNDIVANDQPDAAAKIDSVYRLMANVTSGIKDSTVYQTAQDWQTLPANVYHKENNDFYNAVTGRWRSLEEPPAIDYLLKINKPILLLNGLASPGEWDNKNIQPDFLRRHKHNLTATFYAGYDHNFFKQTTGETGRATEPEFHWNDVFSDVKKWISQL